MWLPPPTSHVTNCSGGGGGTSARNKRRRGSGNLRSPLHPQEEGWAVAEMSRPVTITTSKKDATNKNEE